MKTKTPRGIKRNKTIFLKQLDYSLREAVARLTFSSENPEIILPKEIAKEIFGVEIPENTDGFICLIYGIKLKIY